MNSILCQCPECGSTIQFKNAVINHVQCESCGVLLLRQENGVLNNCSAHSIHVFVESLQVGSQGFWKDQSFTVIGRYRLWFAESAFNYWSIELQNGSVKILAEAYGLYAIYELYDSDCNLSISTLNEFSFDSPISIGGIGKIDFIRKNECRFWDGEGQFYRSETNVQNTFDAMSDNGHVVEIFQYLDKRIEVYQVFYCSFESLRLTNFRSIDSIGKNHVCNSCGFENKISVYPYSQSWSCTKCAAQYYLFNGGIIPSGNDTRDNNLFDNDLDIGSSIEIKGYVYKVIGFVVKKEIQYNDAYWKEYVLYNSYKGFGFLNESEGHWIFVTEMGNTPSVKMPHYTTFEYEGNTFNLYNRYTFKIVYAKGEFPANIFNDEFQMGAVDYIAPPYLLNFEKSKKEGIAWYWGEHINANDIQKQITRDLPAKYGVGSVEPKGSYDITLFIKATLIGALFLLGIHLLVGFSNREKTLINQGFTLVDSLGQQTYVTDEFELEKWQSNLQFDIYAPVDNSWFELQATLVNKATGDEYAIEQGVEYYHGVEEGESWSEGAKDETTYLSSIPAGRYFLKLHGQKDRSTLDAWGGGLNFFTVRVTNDVPMLRNFWLLLLILIIWPLYKIYTVNRNEKLRWKNSPFSKYTYT